jgi:hypothetical protein
MKISIAAVALTAAALVATTAVPASAAPAYTPAGVCGAGYKVQRSKTLPGAVTYQLYNGATTCVVTIKTADKGKSTRVTAGLQVKGGGWSYDTGDYKYYAGPVKRASKGKCVRYFGFSRGTSYTSTYANCG